MMTPRGTEPSRALAVVPPAALAGEVIAPGDDSVHLTYVPKVFDSTIFHEDLPAGLSIAELIMRVIPQPYLYRYAVVCVGNWRCPRELYAAVRPKPGTRVTIKLFPQGGGSKDILRIVLTIALAAFAIAAPILWPAALFTIGGTAFSVGTVAAFGVGILGAPCRDLLISRTAPA